MSNIIPTVGRPVQYIDLRGVTLAATIIAVDLSNNTVELAVYDSSKGIEFIKGVKEFNAHARDTQVNVYKLTWQGR